MMTFNENQHQTLQTPLVMKYISSCMIIRNRLLSSGDDAT